MVKVDYSNCIVNLSNSLLNHFGVTPFHNSISKVDKLLNGKKKVIVFLFDGMGKAILEKHLDKDSYFRSHVIHTMSATLPPTTVASTNAFLSARFPSETGWFGWVQYFKDLDRNVKVFRNTDKDTGEYLGDENIMNKVASYDNIITLINKKYKKNIAKQYMGYSVGKTPNVRFLNRFVKSAFDHAQSKEETFTYAYWTDPDGKLHENGTTSKVVTSNIKRIQKIIRSYASRNKDVAILVIADHGQVDVTYLHMCDHPDFYNTLKRTPSFEARCLNFYVKDNKAKEFEELFNKYYGKYFELHSRKEVLENHLFGEGEMSPLASAFLGDYIAIAIDKYSLNRFIDDEPLKGHHAGGTPDEFLIDIIGLNL